MEIRGGCRRKSSIFAIGVCRVRRLMIRRFHAWQSSLLFTAIFILHLIFSFSAILSWMLFVVDIGLIAFLTMRAYRDGKLASVMGEYG